MLVSMNLAPLCALAVFFGLALGFRTWHQRRLDGSTGLALFRGRGLRHVFDLGVLVLPLLLLAQATAWAFWPWARAVGSLALPAAVRLAGLAIIGAGLALVLAAQLQMGASWRIGIDAAARPGLITHGLYRLSRNPIYVGMLAALAGFTLLMPTVLTLGVLVVATIGIRFQVGQEERYLAATYGVDFRGYASRVGRFVPGLGRVSSSP
jgi:protein-S-isoprenylcysteine O-methyltransferase Ste14